MTGDDVTWTGICPVCGHDRGDHTAATAEVRAEPDARTILRCSQCSCAVTADGRPWPTAAVEEPPSEQPPDEQP